MIYRSTDRSTDQSTDSVPNRRERDRDRDRDRDRVFGYVSTKSKVCNGRENLDLEDSR